MLEEVSSNRTIWSFFTISINTVCLLGIILNIFKGQKEKCFKTLHEISF